jgi:hypothetical protein
MLTINIKQGERTPFIETTKGVTYILEEVTSETPAQTGTTTIDSTKKIINTYNVVLKVTPAISGGTQTQSNTASSLIDIEKFNKKITFFEINEASETFFNNENVNFNFTAQQINSDNELIDKFVKYLQQYRDMHIERSSTTIRNIQKIKTHDINYYLNNFSDQFFAKPTNFVPFNEFTDDYPMPTIYNSVNNRFEESSVMKILNNYYERVLLNIDANVRINYIYKINYPLKKNGNIKYFNGAYLDPFEVRKQIDDKKEKYFTGIKGVKMFVNNFANNIINTQNSVFFDSAQNFSDEIQVKSEVIVNKFEDVKYNVDTNSIFDRNKKVTNFRKKIIKSLQEKKTINKKQINLGFVNDNNNDIIKPFYDFQTKSEELDTLQKVYTKKIIKKDQNNKIISINYQKSLTESIEIYNENNVLIEQHVIKKSFWDNINPNLNEIVQDSIISSIKKLQDNSNIISILNQDIEYGSAGFVVENNINVDSKVYTGLKE